MVKMKHPLRQTLQALSQRLNSKIVSLKLLKDKIDSQIAKLYEDECIGSFTTLHRYYLYLGKVLDDELNPLYIYVTIGFEDGDIADFMAISHKQLQTYTKEAMSADPPINVSLMVMNLREIMLPYIAMALTMLDSECYRYLPRYSNIREYKHYFMQMRTQKQIKGWTESLIGKLTNQTYGNKCDITIAARFDTINGYIHVYQDVDHEQCINVGNYGNSDR